MKKILLLLLFMSSYFCFANCTQPDFCKRSCWDTNGTRPAQTSPTYTTPTHIIVHHTGDGVVFPANTNYAEKVRYYWDLHVNTNGWSDIGYNWLIDRNGVIYEGRGDGVQGAHFSGHNSRTMGVSMIGDFTLETPSASAINSLKNLIAWEATDKNIDVTGVSYHSSSNRTLNNISGHKDGGATSCPGTDLYSLLPSIRTSVSNYSCYNGTSNYADLVIEKMWTEPANPIAGENVDLYVEIKNIGNETAESISLDYKIENNTIGSDTHTSLAPDETKTFYYNDYVFSTDVTYNYCVFINAVTNEQNSGNNSYCISLSVNDPGDIVVSNTTANPTTVEAGNTIDVTATQSYSGIQLDADLPSINLGYYLSTDCNLSSDDILLGTSSSSLGSDNTTQNESATLTIPSNIPSGTYSIIFSADNDNGLTEKDEVNNINCIQIIVTDPVPLEDIEVTNATVSPMTVNAGNDINVTVTQSYSGSQLAVDLPSFDLGYYLSTDCDLSSNDILLGTSSSSLGTDNATQNESATLTIPDNTDAGTYYIIFSGDNNNGLIENDEANNISCVQITVDAALAVIDFEFKNQLKVFPNPTSDIVNIISTTNLVINKLYIYDLNGRLVKSSNDKNLNKINISELTKGMYLLKVIGAENKSAVFRIIKK